MSTCTLSPLSLMHALILGLGLDVGNSLDQTESACALILIHRSQSFQKKADGLYLTTPMCDTGTMGLLSVIQ